ncbi:hypothetical protein F4802DRAFT_557401 [Xylaria palmicola]|nr:hypothetical protein F4802DRAFT_557401 [Xylaria palmicola]
MSYPTPRQTPERQSQLLAQGELSPESPPSSSRKHRLLTVISAPIKLFGGLGSPTSSQFVGSPPLGASPQFQANESNNGSQATESSQPFYKTALAPFRSSRQRQGARLRRVHHLISFIEEIQNQGYLGRKEAIPIQLFPKDYIELLLEVDKRDSGFQDYFNYRLRYAYNESRYGNKQFTIFMLSDFHKRMSTSIDMEVRDWSCQVCKDDHPVEVQTAAGNIQIARDESIETENKPLYPDCSFKYEGTNRPPVVFEIAWSQSSDDLRKRALELIQETKGEVRTVIGLDFSKTRKIWTAIRDQVGTGELPNRGPATAFVWRARFDENGQQLFRPDGQPSIQKNNYRFCNDDGNACTQTRAKIQLSVKDFIPLQVISSEGWNEVEGLDNTRLEFDPLKMIQFIDKALKVEKAAETAKQPRRIKIEQKKNQAKQEQEARRAAAAVKEQKRWTIPDVSRIGGYGLRRSERRDRVVAETAQEEG